MNIPLVNRPFNKQRSYGYRLTRNRIYRTKLWTNTIRPAFFRGTTEWNGQQVSNKLCIECYKEGIRTPTHTVDHIIAIEDGGSATDLKNMQGLCLRHHNGKSAREGNERRKLTAEL